MLVFRPISLIEGYEERSLAFSFEDDIDYKDDEGSDEEEKSGEICKFFLKGNCNRDNCDFRHTRGEKAVVCKHWLRGLCKKDKLCEFLHEYDMSKMPICHFFSNYDGVCTNEDCVYRHVDAEAQQGECAWYARGFCKHGRNCRNKHVKKEACLRYLTGFCPKGPECEFGHPKYELPEDKSSEQNQRQRKWVCRVCNQPGHRDFECPKNGGDMRGPPRHNRSNYHSNTPYSRNGSDRGGGGDRGGGDRGRFNGDSKPRSRRPLTEVTCFKCTQMGHYANNCQNQAVPRENLTAQQNQIIPEYQPRPPGPPGPSGPPGPPMMGYPR